MAAFLYLNKFINQAKKENNLHKLFQGYKEATYYSADKNVKIKYSDSCISTALKTQDNDLISSAHLGKGIVYYSNYRQYVKALNQYLIAFDYSEKGADEYQKQKINYHIGVVKSYLGYYNDALLNFKNGVQFFKNKTSGDYHRNEIYNNSKGYLNSLHQAIICNQYLQNYKDANSLIQEGLRFTQTQPDFLLEKNYFLKSSAISDYNADKLPEALNKFNESLPVFEKKQDFMTVGIVNYYLGRTYERMGDSQKTIQQFKKVDSIFSEKLIFFPELRKNYEYLINYYKNNSDEKNELLYTKKLLKVDSIMNSDFKYLSAKIHREYDTVALENAKKKLEKQNSFGVSALIFLFLIISVLSFLVWKYYNNQNEIKRKYLLLENRLTENAVKPNYNNDEKILNTKILIPDEIYHNITRKLEKFEDRRGYIEKGLTLAKLAKRFNTNATYLSQVINETRKLTFNKYLSELRINYITNRLYNDNQYLKYTVESLAEECGIASRQNFSDLFKEINGIRPKDFIALRRKELGINT
ncbi:helix-turn-helix transcriptional regulator [Chryseobacterium manosquense]|uniref:Helix-turn-helix transcriptional regulator n=1 Tax=Chryseobacterium manosquense TaxID=2754694 RepID=A0A7H1DXF7_9FLAO|nr:helix-turn-helix domain-containing protein [Chryseobacterium manosquense]QNS41665.1 helix-turn-helix transcriptional regulator [Chryseobacterium manosquense]